MKRKSYNNIYGTAVIGTATLLAAATYGAYKYNKEQKRPVNVVKNVVNDAVESAVKSLKDMDMM